MDLTTVSIIISIAAFLSSVLSPILVQLITNYHQRKRGKLEFVEKHKHEVIENYIKAVGAHIYSGCRNGDRDYASTIGEIYMYVDQSLWGKVEELTNEIVSLERNTVVPPDQLIHAKELYIDLCKSLSVYSRDSKKNQTR